MKFIGTILLSVLATFTALFLIVNFVPQQSLDFFFVDSNPKVGATITTILGTDTLSDFPAVINANLASLNADKIEISDLAATTSLPNITTLTNLATIGTITSGTWNGTTIAVTKGGTGSTTLSAFSILLGSTTNAVGTVSGFGTTGQFLTSNGAGVAPSWQTSAINQGDSYTWTGTHSFSGATITFNATTSIAASSTTTAPLVLNGLNYQYPVSFNAASSTVMQNDGNGKLSFVPDDWTLLADVTSSASASISLSNFIGRSDLLIIADITGIASVDNAMLRFNGDTSGNYGVKLAENYTPSAFNAQTSMQLTPTGTTSPQYFILNVSNISGNRKHVTITGGASSATTEAPAIYSGAGIWNNTTAQITQVTLYTLSANNFSAGTRLRVFGARN